MSISSDISGVHKIAAWEKEYGVPAELYSDLRTFKRTVKSWKKEILNYFETGCTYTNAIAEGTNNLIERINRQGNGYSFERLRAKALFWHIAAPPTRYTLKKKTKAIYKEPDFSTTSDYYPGMNPYKPKKIGTEAVLELVAEDVVSNRKPLSVLRYVDSNE